MSKKELLRTYRFSLNLSLVAMATICVGLGVLVTINNQEAIYLLFFKPLVVVAIALAFAFIAIPFLTIIINYIKSVGRYSPS